MHGSRLWMSESKFVYFFWTSVKPVTLFSTHLLMAKVQSLGLDENVDKINYLA